jgi:dolichyl-phosphate beta-glucosyltransferase
LSQKAPLLSVVVPAYNESARLPLALETVGPYLEKSGVDYELILVDDGSSDQTFEQMRAAAEADPRIKAIHNEHLGKGRAVATGVLATRGELVLISDTDFSTPIEEWVRLRAALDDFGAQVAIGSRAKRGAREIEQPIHRVLMGKSFNLLVQVIALPGLWDTQCGFKLFKGKVAREVFDKLHTDGFAFDVEALMRARRAGYKVAEVPVVWRHSAPSRIAPLKHSAQMLRDIIVMRFRR